MRNRFPVAKYNYLVKHFVLCTLTLEEAKKAAKNSLKQCEEVGWFNNPLNPDFSFWNYKCIIVSFVWADTPEGLDYWDKINLRLCRNRKKA